MIIINYYLYLNLLYIFNYYFIRIKVSGDCEFDSQWRKYVRVHILIEDFSDVDKRWNIICSCYNFSPVFNHKVSTLVPDAQYKILLGLLKNRNPVSLKFVINILRQGGDPV